MLKVLDVGSGSKPRGDVNVDRYREVNPEVTQFNPSIVDIRSIPNFIQADALYLPFRDNLFSMVFCSHVIEHVFNPYLLLRELIRVCKIGGKIEIKCPHRFSKGAKKPFHKHFFTRKWFSKNIKLKHEISTTDWCPIPFMKIFEFPDEIKVKIIKDNINFESKN